MNGHSSNSSTDQLQNNISVEWSKVKVDNPFPSREGQCCCSLCDKVYVFGGVILEGDGLSESNDLLCFNSETKQWQKVASKNDGVPPPRSAASIVAVGNKLYLFGGLNQLTGWLDDLHVFDTEKLTWTELKPEGKGPCARDKFQAAAIGTNIYLFGGFGPKMLGEEEMEDDDDEEYEDEDELPSDQQAAEFGWFNDLFVYDTVNNKWSQPIQMNLGVPTARAAHGMCASGSKLVIFGGKDMEGRQNDIHIFDTESRKWDTELKPNGKKPEPRSFHTTTAVGNRVVVLGGRGKDDQHFNDFNIFDIDTREWYQPKVSGDIPCARSQQSVCIVKDNLLLFGGSSNFSPELMHCQSFHNDTYLLQTGCILKGEST